MANTQGINYGARPITEPGMPPKLMYLRANTSQAIYRGQFVAINNSGQIAVIAPGDLVASIGIAWSFLAPGGTGLPTGMTTTTAAANLPASTDAVVGYTYDPQQLYVMEEITGGVALTAISVGQLVNWTYTATTGNTTTGYATTVIQNSSVSSGTGPLLQLLQFQNITNQDGTANAAGASAKWIVRIANHQLNGTRVGVPQG